MAIRLRFAVTGSTGLVGEALVAFLRFQGHDVLRVVRPQTRPLDVREKIILWDPQQGLIDRDGFEGLDAVFNLAGSSIAGQRWDKDVKEKFFNSRIETSALLAARLARLKKPPRALVSISASGFYGFGHGVAFTEEDGPGEDFLAQLCAQWEEAANPARAAGIRLVHPRLGTVLSFQGGALKKMFLPFKWALGGVIGSGRQPFSWISLHDAVSGLSWIARQTEIEGPVNLAAPQSITQGDFAKALGQAVNRPTWLRLPAWMARKIIGELADAAVLQGQTLNVEKLLFSGFQFQHPEIDTALGELLEEKREADG